MHRVISYVVNEVVVNGLANRYQVSSSLFLRSVPSFFRVNLGSFFFLQSTNGWCSFVLFPMFDCSDCL